MPHKVSEKCNIIAPLQKVLREAMAERMRIHYNRINFIADCQFFQLCDKIFGVDITICPEGDYFWSTNTVLICNKYFEQIRTQFAVKNVPLLKEGFIADGFSLADGLF